MRSDGQATAGTVKRTDAAMAAGALFVCSNDNGNYQHMNFVLAGRSTGAVLARSQGGAAQPWYLAGGTIALANVAEWVESPSQGQLYAGGALTGAWAIVARTAYSGAPGISGQYILDSAFGRVIFGLSVDNQNGFYVGGAWRNVALFSDTNTHVYTLISDGNNVQAYIDNVPVGAAVAATTDIAASGNTRWRSANNNSAGAAWVNAVARAAVYGIALDATQRAALQLSISAS